MVKSQIAQAQLFRRRRTGLFLSVWLFLSALCAFSVSASGQTSAAQAGTALRIDLPASGEVRIENRRGGITVEVGTEPFVSVAAESAAGGAVRGQSPVRLERSEELLKITVAQAAGTGRASVGKRRAAGALAQPGEQTRVDLRLRVPSHARVALFTGEGKIEINGLPATLAAQTVSGGIHLRLHAPHDAQLSAHSLNGQVAFSNGTNATSPETQVTGRKFLTRLGAGTRAARLFSGRGRIEIEASTATGSNTSLPASEPRSDATGTRAVASSETRAAQPRGNQADEPRAPTLRRAGEGEGAFRQPAPQASESPEEVDEDDVVRVESDLVTLNVSVVDRTSGRGLTGLAQSDFRLAEDGLEQQIQHFEANNAPFDLLLLIDLSGSTGKVTNLIRAAALRFISAARPQDRIAIITFAGDTNIVSPLTSDRESLRARINAMEPPKGDTRLYDAVNTSMDYLLKESAESRRRAIVLMSDGLDSTLPNVTGTGSTITYEELRRRVEEFDGIFYSIWTSTEYEAFSPEDIQPETFDLVHRRMEQTAEAGGGVFYEVERLEDLAGAYERVVADLGTVYSLSYRPSNKTRDGRWRSIRVRLPRRPEAVARGKRGYYAK